MSKATFTQSLGQAVIRLLLPGNIERDIPMSDCEPERCTYGVFKTGFAPAASPTDVIVIQGSATKKIRIKSIILNCAGATANSSNPVQLLKRSAANTGGTSTVLPLGRHDSTDPTPTAVVRLYSANPTGLGAVMDTGADASIALHGGRVVTPTSPNNLDRMGFQYAWQGDKGIILNGLSEFLCVGLGGAALVGSPTFDVDILLNEE